MIFMIKYAPVDKCIYCGATTDLTDEHIIPLALNGDWLLPKASCRICASITSKFEAKVLRGPLWLPRAALGLRTRRRGKQPTSFPLCVTRGGVSEKWDVPVAKNLPSVILPLFERPGFLSDSPSFTGVRVSGFYIGHTLRSPEQVRQELAVDTIALEMYYPTVEFARMIAKIAYGYAVAKLGLNHIVAPLIVPAILGQLEDIGQWVGTVQEANPAPISNALHLVKVFHEGNFVIAAVSLFTLQPAPIYMVAISMGSRNLDK